MDGLKTAKKLSQDMDGWMEKMLEGTMGEGSVTVETRTNDGLEKAKKRL